MNVWMPIIMFESSRELVATAFDISDSAKNDRSKDKPFPGSGGEPSEFQNRAADHRLP